MKTEHVPIDNIRTDERNVRKHSKKNLETIKRSLQKFGQQKPIVVGADSIVVAGNGTLDAARALGWTHIDVVRTKLEGSARKAYAVADNRTAELAEWDDEGLGALLASLQEDVSFDETLTGFDAREIELLMGSPEVVEDDAPAVPETAVTRVGDLWVLGDHRVLCGDATKGEDVGRLLDGRKPFIMVTDPPYGVGYQGGETNAAKRERLSGDDSADLYEPAYALCPCEVSYVWFADCNALPVYSACVRHGFRPRALLIWNKLNAHYGAPSAHYKQRHEPCLYAVRKGSAKFVGDMKTPTVWDIEQPHRNEDHPTQKPVQCMLRPIRNHGDKDDDVYDPFLGSGTTLIAAEQLGRRAFGLEIEPRYCDVTLKRWMNLTGKSPVRESDGKAYADLISDT